LGEALAGLVLPARSDLGGEDELSEGEKSLLRRIVTLEVQCEMQESSFARREGEIGATALDLYSRTSNTLRRLLESVGLQRRAKDVTPSLSEYTKRQVEEAELVSR